MIRRFLTDERLLRVFTFQGLYVGVPPRQALAAYAVIAYMDTVSGVYFPRGGMRALPDALAAAASDAGVEFSYNSAVCALERSGDRVTAVQTGPFRPGNTIRGIDNAGLAGSSTVPGVGIPTAIVPGRLAADRITGTVERGQRRTVTQ